GLQVLDISNPTAPPVWKGQYDTPGSAWSAAAAGKYVYVADNVAGLMVIDVSNPQSPSLAGSYDTPGTAYDVKIAGDHAFIADGSTGLQVIDVSDPTTPVSVGSYDTPGEAISIDVDGDVAYIADRGNGLVVVNIGYLPHPTLLDMYDTPGDCWGVAVSGDHVYLGDALQGIHVINATNLVDLSYVTTVDPGGSHRRLYVDGDYLYSAAYGTLYAFDISDPAFPSTTGSYTSANVATTVVVDGEYAYAACGSGGGLKVVDVADGFRPFRIGGFDSPITVVSAAIHGDYAYIVESGTDRKFRVLDARYPDGLPEIGSYDMLGLDLCVAGDYAYVAAQWNGLTVLDVSAPSTPVLHGSYATSGSAQGIVVSGDLAFVAQGNSGLAVIDITNPASPTELGSYDTALSATSVDVAGNIAYLTVGSTGLLVIDVTNSSSPTQVGSYDTSGIADDVVVAGDYAYVADRTEGMSIIDVSDPTTPTLVARVTGAWTAYAVAVAGNYAFVTDGTSVQRIDIEDPTDPQILDEAEVGGTVSGLVVEGDILYAGFNGGLASMRIFHRRFSRYNTARSLPINDTADKIERVRLTTTQFDSIQWEVSADGGGHFGVARRNVWEDVQYAGSSLIWRSTHYPKMMTNPECSQLTVDWLFDKPIIESIVDVPDDEGGWVNLRLIRSGYDFAETDGGAIEEYVIWRRHQDVGTGIDLVPGRPMPQSVDLPPGSWEPVDTFAALREETYDFIVSTALDEGEPGAGPSVFVVSAHRASGSYTSDPDSGYSVDDIPPSTPTGISVDYYTGHGNYLTWDSCPDPDFHEFWIYRGNREDFYPWPENRVATTMATDWYDPLYDGGFFFYKVSAVDHAGNESPVGLPDILIGVGPDRLPEHFALHPNSPNPFNPTTRIRYDVPAGAGSVSLKIYDVSGRLVRTLVDGVEPPGRWVVEWNAEDDGGTRVASGVYFCRMRAAGYARTHKMVLLQ
ncbi:MAG: FlgD immunoglobulin-like domain containing protein, partial [bacterium]